MKMTDDPSVLKPLSFLREREIVHFQRFGEALNKVRDYLTNEHSFIIKKPNCKTKNEENNFSKCENN